MGEKLDAMKKAAKPAAPKAEPTPAPAPNPPQKPHTRKPWKHRHQLKGRLPDGSIMEAVYLAKNETEGEWAVTLFIPNKQPILGMTGFQATRSALFAACVAADKMYRETLVPTQEGKT